MEIQQQLYTSQQVKTGEAKAAKACGVSMYALMKRAGKAVFDRVRNHYPQFNRWDLVCGGGNNGGDGYVIGRLALQAGIDVNLMAAVTPSKLTGDAKMAMEEFVQYGGKILNDGELEGEVIIDALLGTGINGEVRQKTKYWIQKINDSGAQRVSVDLPSGLCSDTGCILGIAVKAHHTVSFIGLKQGLFTGRARNCTGQIHYAGLDIEQAFSKQNTPTATLIDTSTISKALLPRENDSHKGHFGRTLLIGGCAGMGGAIILSSEACARVGSGLTAALTANINLAPSLTRIPEVMCGDWANRELLNARLEWCSVVAIGPGMGRGKESAELFQRVSEQTHEKLTIVDADGLWHLANNPDKNSKRIITPHPGEAAMLLGCTVEEIEANRYTAIQAMVDKFGGVCILKGAGTLVANKNMTYVCPAGNPGMASGGMGDVLTGVLAGLLAQGASMIDAACAGVLLHSQAADELAFEYGQVGLLASDLAPKIRSLIKNQQNYTSNKSEENAELP